MFTVMVFLFLHLASSGAENNGTACDGIEAPTFNLSNVLGSWYVAGLVTHGKRIPEKVNPCFRVEFSEADEAGLRWLVENHTHLQKQDDWTERIKGTTVRQRYHIDHPYDTWSRNLEDPKGCFEEVLTIHSDDKKIYKTSENDTKKATMQLHLLTTDDGLGPYLIQLLWGEMVSAVLYRRRPGTVTQQELEPSLTLLQKMRVGQELTRICEKTPKSFRGQE